MRQQIAETPTETVQPTILVAEDNESNFILIEETFKTQQHTIIRAENGLEAIKIVQSRDDIDLILMDIRMPVLSGYDASKRISKLRPEIPIIIQSAYAMSKDIQKAKEAGCCSFIAKPIDPQKLISVVNKFLK
ncbi:response regulator [Puniceicoccaceae bacterium K14]|nr:response regulator [Puniceicoccaceae bacterium K14]